MNRMYIWVLFSLLLTFLVSARGAPITFELDTRPLLGHGAAPFYGNFQLTDGSGENDGKNTIEVSHVEVQGGAVAGTPMLIGGASGDLSSTVRLSDTQFLNSFTQFFMPGEILRFTLFMDPKPDPGSQSDQFSFAILDQHRNEIPTFGPADALIVIDLDGSSPVPQTFRTDPTRVPIGGGLPIDMNAPQVVPEPGTNALLGIALLIAAVVTKQVRSRSRTLSNLDNNRRSTSR